MARSYEYYLKHWSELDTNIANDPDLVTFLEPKRAELENEEQGMRNMLDVRAAGNVQSQEATRALERHVQRGTALMVQLHDQIRGFYGRDSEKLKQFQIPIRRPRKAKRANPDTPPSPETPVEANKKPSEPGPNPTQTAAPETDGTT